MTYKPDLVSVKINQHANYRGQTSASSSIVIVWIHIQTHIRPIAPTGPLKWSVMIFYRNFFCQMTRKYATELYNCDDDGGDDSLTKNRLFTVRARSSVIIHTAQTLLVQFVVKSN